MLSESDFKTASKGNEILSVVKFIHASVHETSSTDNLITGLESSGGGGSVVLQLEIISRTEEKYNSTFFNEITLIS